MKLRNVLLTSILVMALVLSSVFTVFAEGVGSDALETVEESGSELIVSVFGENGSLSNFVAGGAGVEAMEGITSEGLDTEAGEEGESSGFNLGDLGLGDLNLGDLGLDDLNLGDLSLNDLNLGDLGLNDLNLGDLNLGDLNVGDLLGGLLGDSGSGEAGSDEFDFGDLGALIEVRQQIMEAEKAYVIDMNAERLMPGEIQIVADTIIWQDENFDLENNETQDLNKMVQFNYNLNEEGQLEHVSGIELVILFTLQKDENGNYAVIDAELCDEGENYMPSIEALCEKVGEPIDDCIEELDFSEWDILYELINYMEEHPEVTAVEYNGEMRTADELSDLQLELSLAHEEKYPVEEEDYKVEEGGEDAIAEDGESSGLNLEDLNLGDLNVGDLLGGLLGDSGSDEAGSGEAGDN